MILICVFLSVTAELNRDRELEGPPGLQDPLVEHLRPVTPTGSVVDSDPDLLVRSKPASPTVQEWDRPQTPGMGIAVELGCEDSADEANAEHFIASSTALQTLYQDRPRTPGRENKNCWTLDNCVGEPDRETAECSTLTRLPAASYVRAPKTPGRDIILSQKDIFYRRKHTSQTLLCDSHRASSPCCISDSDSSDGRESWISSGVRAKPLQGLENVPGLLYEGSWRERPEAFLKRKEKKKLKRRWKPHQRQRSLKRIGGSHYSYRRRSPGEERRILHKVWRDGLDEEDAKLLHCAYDRLHAQSGGLGWIDDALWTPHPHILLVRCRLDVSAHTFILLFSASRP